MACVVSIDDTEFYIPCDQFNNLELINGLLVNTGSSSISLKSSFSVSGNNLPFISCNANSACRLYSTSAQEYTSVTSAPVLLSDPLLTYKYDYLIFCLLLILVGVKLIWKK